MALVEVGELSRFLLAKVDMSGHDSGVVSHCSFPTDMKWFVLIDGVEAMFRIGDS
jgi:hypothetical protein